MTDLAPHLTEPTPVPIVDGLGPDLAAATAARPPASDALNLAEAPPSVLAEGQRRFAIVEPLLTLPREGREAAMHAAAVATNTPLRTLYRWVTAARTSGLAGLLPKWGTTKGRFTALSPTVQEFLINEYCQPKQPSPTTVYRRLEIFCAHLRLPTPCASTVNRFLRSIPPSTVVLGRIGPKAWRAGYEPKAVRDFSDLPVGAWWVADHREFDVFVRLGDPDGERIVRPWFTAWLDLRSRVCVGWQVSLGPDSDTIACALRDGILHYGIPQHLYRDNGKDFTCHYWGGKTRLVKGARLTDVAMTLLAPGVLAPMGIRTHEATPYTPWSKPIEGWFGAVFPEWEKTLPGWCGRDAKQRPEKLAREIQDGELLTLDEFVDRVAECLDLYHHRAQEGLGGTPLEQWRGATIERPDPRTLDLLLMRGGKAHVTTRGIQRFGRHYWHDRLVDVIGDTVEYRYDPTRIGALVCFRGGKFFCEATHAPTLRMGASQADLKELHRKKQLAKRRARAALDDRTVLFTPERVLADLAAERRKKQVYVLRADRTFDPTIPPGQASPPPAGARAIPRMLPAFDHAAQALAEAQHASAAPDPRLSPMAEPASAHPGVPTGVAASAPPLCPLDDTGLAELLAERPDASAREQRECEKAEALKELLG